MKTKTKLRLVQLGVALTICLIIWMFFYDPENRLLSGVYFAYALFLLGWAEFLIRRIPRP